MHFTNCALKSFDLINLDEVKFTAAHIPMSTAVGGLLIVSFRNFKPAVVVRFVHGVSLQVGGKCTWQDLIEI